MNQVKVALTIFIGILAISMTGCTSEDKVSDRGNQPTQPQVPPPQPQQTNTQESAPPKPLTTGPAVSGLIQPTDPDRRRQTIVRGRQDPFAPSPVEPKITFKPKPKAQIQPPSSPPLRIPSSPSLRIPSSPSLRTPSSPSLKTPSKGPSKPSFELPKPSFVPAAPQPVLARGVLVTGVVQVDGVTQAIVKAPNERFSRYVLPGQYIANGQVLVKRINMNQRGIPSVVLEEVGIEVFKEVGEKPENTTAQISPVPTDSNLGNSRPISTALLPETLPPHPAY